MGFDLKGFFDPDGTAQWLLNAAWRGVLRCLLHVFWRDFGVFIVDGCQVVVSGFLIVRHGELEKLVAKASQPVIEKTSYPAASGALAGSQAQDAFTRA